MQELQQGFELRYDLVLQFSHAASGGRLQLGPPNKQLLGTAAIESALQRREDLSKQRGDAALFIQIWSRSRAVRRAGGARAEVVASARAVAIFGRPRGRLDRSNTETMLLKAALQPDESSLQLCRRKCVGCLKRLFFRVAAPIRRASIDAKRAPSPSGRSRRRRWSQERQDERARSAVQCASEQEETLAALRLARIDYVLVRPFGDDRVFACLTASLATLQARAVADRPCYRSARAPPPTTTQTTSLTHSNLHPTRHPNPPQAHAEDIELHARLRRFAEGRERELHEGTNCVPRVPFVAKRYPADFCLFRSRERCERRSHPHAHTWQTRTARARACAPHLHRTCTAPASHLHRTCIAPAATLCTPNPKHRCELLFHLLEARGARGARLDLEALKFNGVLKDFFLLHHPREQARLPATAHRPPSSAQRALPTRALPCTPPSSSLARPSPLARPSA